jgi:hypothetical protein
VRIFPGLPKTSAGVIYVAKSKDGKTALEQVKGGKAIEYNAELFTC